MYFTFPENERCGQMVSIIPYHEASAFKWGLAPVALGPISYTYTCSMNFSNNLERTDGLLFYREVYRLGERPNVRCSRNLYYHSIVYFIIRFNLLYLLFSPVNPEEVFYFLSSVPTPTSDVGSM